MRRPTRKLELFPDILWATVGYHLTCIYSCIKIYCPKATIVDKTNLTPLQCSLSPHSLLINEWLRQRKAELSTKAPTIANLQHWNEGKGGQREYTSRIFSVTLGFVQDCSTTSKTLSLQSHTFPFHIREKPQNFRKQSYLPISSQCSTPLKSPENLWFSDVFRGVRNG